MRPQTALQLADAILVVHTAFVVFVIFGLVLILCGGLRGWRWVRNFWFRLAHVAAIGFVVIQAWCGALCPLTRWEAALRARAGEAAYEGSFIAHWLQEILYYDAPAWVFVAAYTVFGLLVLASWRIFPPRSFK